MTQALFLSTLLLLAAPSASPRTTGSKFAAAQIEFNRGNYTVALKLLTAAEDETADEASLARVFLLEGQAHGAVRDFPNAEQAFAKALEHDPEIKLDPTKVDPDLVKMLDSLRDRLRGEFTVKADHPGARVFVDGRSIGVVPLRTNVSIGRHNVEVKTPDGRFAAAQQVVITTLYATNATFSLSAVPQDTFTPPKPADPMTAEIENSAPVMLGIGKPFADLRTELDPFQLAEGLAFEIGAGLESQYFRLSLHARVYPIFGATAKAALSVPIVERFRGYVSLEVPLMVPAPSTPVDKVKVSLGLGGAGGVEWLASRWLSLYFELGARHFFIMPASFDGNRLTMQAGFRLRLP